jgi:hypothetical protein
MTAIKLQEKRKALAAMLKGRELADLTPTERKKFKAEWAKL